MITTVPFLNMNSVKPSVGATMTQMKSRLIRLVTTSLLVGVFALGSGCQFIVSSATNRLFKDLETSILNSDDPDLIAAGIPSFLILLDGMLEQNPRDVSLLLVAAQLKSSYATAFVDELERQRRYASKAREHALNAACFDNADLCELERIPFVDMKRVLGTLDQSDIDVIFVLTGAWSSWILVHSHDFRALAQISRVQMLVERMLELDEGYEFGSPHMYMGVFKSLVPPTLGGDSDSARYHFERAISLSEGKNLYAKVLFAERYARNLLDRELHDQLLDEVLAADPVVAGLTLQNRLAQQRARELKDNADEFF